MKTHYPESVFQHCPRCGSSDYTATQRDHFRCADCAFEFFVNACAAVAALIEDPEGRLLLTVRAREPFKGMLDLPGGFVDILETAEEALAREIREELNVTVTDARYLFSSPNRYLYKGLTYFTLDMAFACRVDDLSGIQVADDVTDIRFLAEEDVVLEEIGGESIQRIVSRYFQL